MAMVAPAAGADGGLLERAQAAASSCGCRGSRRRAAPRPAPRRNAAVSVATPERRPSRLSATRSPASRARAEPDDDRDVPRAGRRSTRPPPTSLVELAPAGQPEHLGRDVEAEDHSRLLLDDSRPRRSVGSGTVASVVTSPSPRSSASARATSSVTAPSTPRPSRCGPVVRRPAAGTHGRSRRGRRRAPRWASPTS